MKNKKGFTLVELLTAIIITGVLVAMAVPMYEKSIERSRLAEVRTRLAKLFDSKIRIMTDMSMYNYDPNILSAQNLDVSFPCDGGTTCSGNTFATKDFIYSLTPNKVSIPGIKFRQDSGVAGDTTSGVCAIRRTGEAQLVRLLYLGDLVTDESKRFLCQNGSSTNGCEFLGMVSSDNSTLWCDD